MPDCVSANLIYNTGLVLCNFQNHVFKFYLENIRTQPRNTITYILSVKTGEKEGWHTFSS